MKVPETHVEVTGPRLLLTVQCDTENDADDLAEYLGSVVPAYLKRLAGERPQKFDGHSAGSVDVSK